VVLRRLWITPYNTNNPVLYIDYYSKVDIECASYIYILPGHSLLAMEKVLTADGSVTFRNESVDEIYHTKSGAVEEAIEKYAKPCNIERLSKKGILRILDICFGLGYNSAAAIDLALHANPGCSIEIVGLENDKQILKLTSAVNPGFKCYSLIQKAATLLTAHEGSVKLNIVLGDARVMINSIEPGFDAVFLDPFSPKKAPELWTEDFFRDIHEVMKKQAVLATYSCARTVRDNLRSAGFVVKDGPVIGRRSPATLAVKT
jgi:hypothetical protein